MADIAINPVTRRVQFTGNTGTGPFAFTFNILADEDIAVYKNTTLLTLTTHYSVTTNANGTGSITLVAGQALISSDVLTIIGGRDLSRTTDFVTAGDLLASSLNEQLDSLVIMTQQLDEKVGRTIKTNPGDVYTDLELPTKDNRKGTVLGFNATSGDPEVGPTIADVSSLASITADIATLADIEDGTDATDAIQTVAGISANVTTVAGISSNVTTVAGNTSNINAVAADATDIGTVAGSISNVNTVAGIDSNITTVAGNTTNINTVAGNNSNITTVAGVSANVTTVAGISSDVTTVAGISSDVTTVAADGTDIGTVATNIADVNTVASNIATISAKVSKSGDTMTGDLTIQGNLTVSGTTITVDSATAQSIDLGDGDKMRFGDSNDAYIEWNTSGYFDVRSTGRFDLLSSGNDLRLSTATNVGLIVNHTGGTPAVQLYNSGVERLATTSTGVDITGTLTSDGLTVDGTVDFSTGTGSNVVLGNTGSFTGSETAQLVFEEGSTELAQVQWNPSGNTFVLENKIYNAPISFRTFGATERLKIDGATGDISFYEDTGTTAKFFWDASAESLGIGTDLPSANLHLSGSGARKIDITDTGGANTRVSTANSNSYVGSTTNHPLLFITNDTERMRIDSSGQVGIGTTSPAAPLEVSTSSADYRIQLTHASGQNKIKSVDGDQSTFRNLIYDAVAHYFEISGSNAMLIDSNGRVGIGTSSPSEKLTVSGAISSTSNAVDFNQAKASFDYASGAGRISAYASTGSNLQFYTNPNGSTVSEAMRIDSSGNVGIGTSSPAQKLHVNGGQLQVTNGGTDVYLNTSATSSYVYTSSTPFDIYTAGSSRVRVGSTGNVGIGTTSPNQPLHVIGNTQSTGSFLAGSSLNAATPDYTFLSDTSLGMFRLPNVLGFSVAGSERMRIDSNGNLFVGATALGSNANFFGMSPGNAFFDVGHITGVASGVSYARFIYGGSVIGSITQSGTTAVAYNTSSDYRLKENVVDLTGATTRLKQLEPKRFNFIADADTTVDGFLAHEVQSVVPEAITGTHNEVDADGNPVYQGIDQSKLVPLLVATIKELEARITALENA